MQVSRYSVPEPIGPASTIILYLLILQLHFNYRDIYLMYVNIYVEDFMGLSDNKKKSLRDAFRQQVSCEVIWDMCIYNQCRIKAIAKS